MAVFSVKYEMKNRGLMTLFKHRLFTIDSSIHKEWNYSELDRYTKKYRLKISDQVKEKYLQDYKEVFDELSAEDIDLIIKRNNGERYDKPGATQYIKCEVPVYALNCLKKLFVSTIIYESGNMSIPDEEYIVFSFDTDGEDGNGTVTVSELYLYTPENNPYYQYARNAVSSLSVEAIGIDNYGFSQDGKVKDFYNWDRISKWKKASEFFIKDEEGNVTELKDNNGVFKENVINGAPGVYMLYDEDRNEFYLGKAINLRERILQHARNIKGNDPIPNFTHYRYSVINEEYRQFLYLIENAGIHDSAWIMEMPTAQKYKSALSIITNNQLSECKVVNTVERQRKVEQ